MFLTYIVLVQTLNHAQSILKRDVDRTALM